MELVLQPGDLSRKRAARNIKAVVKVVAEGEYVDRGKGHRDKVAIAASRSAGEAIREQGRLLALRLDE